MIQQKCPLCSQLSSWLNRLLRRFFGFGIDCQSVDHRTREAGERRAAKINAEAPGCACEKYRMRKYSPCPVENSETLTRFIFSPMLVDKKGKVKPNGFSHVYTQGCSIQRDAVAKNDELLSFVQQFLSIKDDRTWKGVLHARCADIRNISSDDSGQRAVCVYDTANCKNPAHGELFQTQYVIDEADRVELREKLFSAFGNGSMISPLQYREGFIWNKLSLSLQERK